MKLAALLVLVAACGGATKEATTPAPAPADDGMKPLPIPEELKAQVEQASRVGALLYRLDQATAKASDAVLARGTPPDGVEGWVAIPDGDTVTVYFLGADTRLRQHLLYVTVRVPDGGEPVVEVHEPAVAPTEQVELLFMARGLASQRAEELLSAAGTTLCQVQHNTVVIPGAQRAEEGILVYLMAATTDPDVRILAGHQRMRVQMDATVVAEPMSHGCVISKPEPTQDLKVAGAFVTHDLSPTPLESHVFASLTYGIPLLVVTPEHAWAVSGTDIVMMSLPAKK